MKFFKKILEFIGYKFLLWGGNDQAIKTNDRLSQKEMIGSILNNMLKEPKKLDFQEENDEFTDKMFEYLEKNKKNRKFEWEKIELPSQLVDGKSYMAKTMKLPTDFLLDDDRTIEYYDKLIPLVIKDLENLIDPAFEKLYLYKFMFTPLIYDPTTFTPKKGAMVRFFKVQGDYDFVTQEKIDNFLNGK